MFERFSRAIRQSIQHFDLALIQHRSGVRLPKAALIQHPTHTSQ